MKALRLIGMKKQARWMYVEDVKHKLPSGKYSDWAYTGKPENAMELSEWWLARFVADMKFVGADYKIID